MKTASVIIGANFGDEGKGLLTDYLAAQNGERSLVVRYNGGAQAGHTVVTPDGRRHVFSHFGAGSFADCDTYLSQFFIVNPIVAVREYDELRQQFVRPFLLIDAAAFVTTPVDVFINQLLERRRGTQRHGSCGLGINETVTRCLRGLMFRTQAADLLLPRTQLFARLFNVGRAWLPARLMELGVGIDEPAITQFVNSLEAILMRFMDDIDAMMEFCRIVEKPPAASNVIFEGAQGLLLDEDRLEQWPHLTRSKTGLHNVVRIASKLGIDHLDVTYATRSYLTRHGAGPLPSECSMVFNDETNVHNAFQGTLRFAPLSWSELDSRVLQDLLTGFRSGLSIQASVAITWCDQLEPPATTNLSLPIACRVFGPRRTDVIYKDSRAANTHRRAIA